MNDAIFFQNEQDDNGPRLGMGVPRWTLIFLGRSQVPVPARLRERNSQVLASMVA